MKKVYIIHGYNGHPEKNWFPWLKTELENLGIEAHVPYMPHPEAPQLSEWLTKLKEVITAPDHDTYLIGHSLGCITILQYLNTLPAGMKIDGVILVAGFASPIHLTELNNFFEQPLDPEKIKSTVSKIIAINSDNDEHVPFHQAEAIRDLFDAELVKIHGGGHLNEKAGYTQFPLVLEKIRRMFLAGGKQLPR